MNAVQLEFPALGVCIKALNKRESYREDFVNWLIDNFPVWQRFEREALRIWNRGRRHYSARTIIEVLRHESALSDTGVEYKLNDHNTPDLARLFLDLHPACAGLFETRRR